jgi:hypothetical protein
MLRRTDPLDERSNDNNAFVEELNAMERCLGGGLIGEGASQLTPQGWGQVIGTTIGGIIAPQLGIGQAAGSYLGQLAANALYPPMEHD